MDKKSDMTNKEGKSFEERADRLSDKLTKTLLAERGEGVSVPMMVYVAAKFTASVLLGLQEQSGQWDIEEDYNLAVKQLMQEMGKNMRIQSIKNKIEENKKFFREAEQMMVEREKKIAALEREYKQDAFLRGAYDEDDVVN